MRGAALSSLAALPQAARSLLLERRHAMRIIDAADGVREGARLAAAAFHGRRGFSWQRLANLYKAWVDHGRSDLPLIDQVKAGKSPELPASRLHPDFLEHWKSLCERFQRSSKPAYRELIRSWRRWSAGDPRAAIPGYSAPPLPARGQHTPDGWTYNNLCRFLPSEFALTLSRTGRAAAAAHRPLVYTTRRDLWVGSHYLFDDLWHDHMVNVLDTRKTGRPLEFHALDLHSACKFAWGMHVRTEREDGTMEGLSERAMRCLLGYCLGEFGYSPNGTILVVEHGTAAVRDNLEQLLHDLTGGLVTISRSGMEGAAPHAGQYAGRSKGNFRFKAALESLGNLVHNEFSDALLIPGQTGLDIDRRPEQLHGLLKSNDALLRAYGELARDLPHVADLLRFPLLEFRQFMALAAAIYDRINGRTEHALEGWEHYCAPDPVTNTMRRLSPTEVWNLGRPRLKRLGPDAVALILGPDLGREVRLDASMLTFQDKEISVDELRFDASRDPILRDRETYWCVLNPFNPDRLFVFDFQQRLLAVCPRIWRVSRADQAALAAEMERAARSERRLIAPIAARAAAFTRKRAADSNHNAAVLGDLARKQASAADLAERALDSTQ